MGGRKGGREVSERVRGRERTEVDGCLMAGAKDIERREEGRGLLRRNKNVERK